MSPLPVLTPASRIDLISLIDGLIHAGISIIIAVHHPEDIPSTVNGVLHLEKGRVVY